jgi:hypothetical protein
MEKIAKTERKTKRRKKVEVQSRRNSTRTSNVTSTSKTQNAGVLATHTGDSEQGECVGVRVGLPPPEARQGEARQAYEVHHAHCKVVSSNAKWQKLFLHQSKRKDANKERDQGEQEAANQSRDSEVCGVWAQTRMLMI